MAGIPEMGGFKNIPLKIRDFLSENHGFHLWRRKLISLKYNCSR
jgi:hypothetical protein